MTAPLWTIAEHLYEIERHARTSVRITSAQAGGHAIGVRGHHRAPDRGRFHHPARWLRRWSGHRDPRKCGRRRSCAHRRGRTPAPGASRIPSTASLPSLLTRLGPIATTSAAEPPRPRSAVTRPRSPTASRRWRCSHARQPSGHAAVAATFRSSTRPAYAASRSSARSTADGWIVASAWISATGKSSGCWADAGQGISSPARPGDPERRAEQRLGRRGAEHHHQLRLEQRELGDQPGPAGGDVRRARASGGCAACRAARSGSA